MRVPRQAFAFAMAAACSFASAGAMGADPGPDTLPIHVIAVQTGDAYDQAEALTKALRMAVKAMPGWSLGEGDHSLEVMMLSLKCSDPPDASCQSRIADQIKADRFVWGTLNKTKKGNTVVGGLNFWVRGKGTNKVPLDYSSNLTEANEDALRKLASDSINTLTGGPPKGGIHVKAGQVAGQVFLDGQPIGALKNGDGTFMVPSGPHKLTVKAVGYADIDSSVMVKPTGAPTEVSLSMVPVKQASSTNWKRIGGFTALGVGVGLAVGGVVSSLQVNGVQNDEKFVAYRKDHSKSQDVCADADKDTSTTGQNIQSLCGKGKTFQTLQLVFYPVAAVAAGVGIFLVATSGRTTKQTTGFIFDPQVGPTGGKLDVTYVW